MLFEVAFRVTAAACLTGRAPGPVPQDVNRCTWAPWRALVRYYVRECALLAQLKRRRRGLPYRGVFMKYEVDRDEALVLIAHWSERARAARGNADQFRIVGNQELADSWIASAEYNEQRRAYWREVELELAPWLGCGMRRFDSDDRLGAHQQRGSEQNIRLCPEPSPPAR